MSNIPNITDICGTVIESLAETIRNREAVIAELREDNARAEHMCLMREHLLGQRDEQIVELQKQIEGWRDEVEALEKDQKELYRLQESIRPLKTENIRLTAQRDQYKADNERLNRELALLRQDFGRGDAYWTAIRERDDARTLYCEYVAEDRRQGLVDHEDCTPEAVATEMGWSSSNDDKHTPSLFERNEVRRRDFSNQQSDSDPATGVQYGDLV